MKPVVVFHLNLFKKYQIYAYKKYLYTELCTETFAMNK